jgi:hypothetical protein
MALTSRDEFQNFTAFKTSLLSKLHSELMQEEFKEET